MDYQTWLPVYDRILDDFGYDRVGDERARDRLATLVTAFDESRLDWIDGATVAVAGAGPELESEAGVAADADAVIAASAAADRLRAVGVSVDLMVTDLDKTPATAREASSEAKFPSTPACHAQIPVTAISTVATAETAKSLVRSMATPTPRLEMAHVANVALTTQTVSAGPVSNVPIIGGMKLAGTMRSALAARLNSHAPPRHPHCPLVADRPPAGSVISRAST